MKMNFKWINIIEIYLLMIVTVDCFNLENRLPIYKFDKDETSYFGYSVALHHQIDNDKNWILVGAPLGNNPQPNTTRTGTLKRCPLSQDQDDCEDVLTDGRRTEDDNELFEPQQNEIKEGQWLGVTVSTQKNISDSGLILVCAHRYISKSGNSLDNAQYGIGLCYILGNDFSYNEVFEPCKGRKMDKLHEDYGVCQAGTSGSLLSDGTIAVGAPGVYTWRGSIYMKSIEGEYLKRDKQTYYSPHEIGNSPIDKYSYLGMSITGGKFFDDNFVYVSGAPRANNHGQVLFFEKHRQNPMSTRLVLDGEQIASGFGYEIIAADVNGDDNPDLLVSAPFYFGRHEGGAVYVYLNNDKKINLTYDLKLTGKIESRFGIALASLGDINKDFTEDIAIGAPYEDQGVVYIYLGSRQGLSKTPSQIIRASDLGLTPARPITTFGSYLSSGLDVDHNDYPDLVIGAYNSAAAVVLLSRPIISINTIVPKAGDIKPIDPSIKGCPNDEKANVTCFSFKTCCSIDLESSQKRQTLSIVYTIEAETFKGQKKFSRVYFGPDDGTRNNTLQRKFEIATNGEQKCFHETVYVKEGSRDIQSPIKFHLNYTMVEKPLSSSGLVELNPILDQTQADRTFEATFQKDCGNDEVCQSQLEVDASLGLERQKDGSYAFVLGKSEEIQVNVNLKNTADSAYESQLFVIHQSSVTYIAATTKGSVICNQFNSTVVACTMGNPLKRGANAQAILRFDPTGIADNEPQATFTVFANSTSNQTTPRPNVFLAANIIKQADLSIAGYARPPQVFYGGEIKGESAMNFFDELGTQVIHTYQINNDGPWRAPYIEVDIDWPHQVGNDKPQGKWLLYLEDVPVIESTGGANGECLINDRLVNPLKLKIRQSNDSKIAAALREDPIFVKRTNKSHTFAQEYHEKISSSSALNRVRRDHAKIIKSEKLVDRDGKKSNIVNMDCKHKTAKCIKISCKIFNLQRKTEVYIHVKSRLWNSTLALDYPRVDNVKIFSSAKLVIPSIYGINQNVDDDHYSIETHAYPELGDQKPVEEIPWWIIIIGIIVGLILLALFVFILYRCGFFKRRRPDPTLSGNLEKNSESKPFITK